MLYNTLPRRALKTKYDDYYLFVWNMEILPVFRTRRRRLACVQEEEDRRRGVGHSDISNDAIVVASLCGTDNTAYIKKITYVLYADVYTYLPAGYGAVSRLPAATCYCCGGRRTDTRFFSFCAGYVWTDDVVTADRLFENAARPQRPPP